MSSSYLPTNSKTLGTFNDFCTSIVPSGQLLTVYSNTVGEAGFTLTPIVFTTGAIVSTIRIDSCAFATGVTASLTIPASTSPTPSSSSRSVSTSTSIPTSTSPPNSGGGQSSAAKAGIGIGVGLGALGILTLVGANIFTRRYRKKKIPDEDKSQNGKLGPDGVLYYTSVKGELTGESTIPASLQVHELDQENGIHEMGDETHRELSC
ncbi:hypothetical protein G7Y89_g4232 [Cudoniella acicularis]|uniref:Mid2 domain-containing protein n=1 Tax=Cudoniella acicularis TaxID=354080 RepID=A0A8H4W7N3_9HELO|nr:hypothetical protein G7Y89_g4232 [Cudoniella acicularis]